MMDDGDGDDPLVTILLFFGVEISSFSMVLDLSLISFPPVLSIFLMFSAFRVKIGVSVMVPI